MKTLAATLTAVLTALSPIQGIILITILITLVDTVFAIYATIRVNGILAFRSGKLFNIVTKITFYSSAIMLSFAIDTFIFDGQMFEVHNFLAKCAALLFIYIEIKSIDESSMKLGNNSLWVIISELTRKLGKIKQDINKPKD
jgi:hypothetical protein